MKFDYYYGMESEQFTFFRIPRLLIRDRRFAGLSSNAKLLYGLLLDRMSLSMKNGWIDEDNRTYIYYSMDKVMEDLSCAKSTCVRIMAELDDKKGIGLIERVRQGQGKPDRIYVKNFASLGNDSDPPKGKAEGDDDDGGTSEHEVHGTSSFHEGQGAGTAMQKENGYSGNKAGAVKEVFELNNEQNSLSEMSGRAPGISYCMEESKADFESFQNETSRSSKMRTLEKDQETQIPVFSESDFRNFQNETSRSSKIGTLEVSKSDRNYTNNNQTEYHLNNPIYPIYLSDRDDVFEQEMDRGWEDADCLQEQSDDPDDLYSFAIKEEKEEDSQEDRASPEAYMRMVHKNIEYEHFLRNLPRDELVMVQELDQILMDIAYAKGGTFRINGVEYSPDYVREKLRSLNSFHIQYILECMKYRTDVRNIRAYMLTTMVNAIATMDHSYQQQMINDGMGGWG